MQLRRTDCARAALVTLLSSVALARGDSPVDTEVSLTVEPSVTRSSAWVRLENRATSKRAVCLSSIHWVLWHSDGSTDRDRSRFIRVPGGVIQVPGGSSCSAASDWTVLRPSQSSFLLLEIAPAQLGDDLLVTAVVRVGPGERYLTQSEPRSYFWRGKLWQSREPRGGPTRG